ncbi:LuxR C-terminal-related transcriptional regulator [Palleronia caenipelagi]|uniref:Response regulator transcription factor n=1 Tax=Palleronia caenipelagi TaxID=2489174 RepID=A0A547Q9J6_9RHOB|nr:response regulator transcription factor [Palleronia caenipelagi]TRD23020.1 response regulator transcription factor [Palleronia caenipelagi]
MRVLIADDHDLLRDTLVAFLANEGIETLTAASFGEAMQIADSATGLDLVLLDFKMPGMSGLEGVRKALEKGLRVAVISGEANRSTAEQALALGAIGFVPKTMPAKSMISAIRYMVTGEKFAPVEFMIESSGNSDHPIVQKLSARELQVLEGLTEGKSNKEIARDLDLSEPTVKLHIKTMYRKVGVANRTQAAMLAKEEGIF